MNAARRLLSGWIALVLLAPVTAPAGAGEPAQGPGKPPAPESFGSDPYDLLWALRRSDRHNLGSGIRDLLDRLAKSKVPTEDKARGAALGAKLKTGLLADEGAQVTGLIRLGVDVADFADRGDLVWVVRITGIGRGVTQEVWVSSTTAAIRAMLPLDAKPGKK
jgi:hypothetical protein